MKRMKKHKVKKEKSETSTSYTKEQEDHDLAFYIHDRVELMHQVFSVLKYKELMALAPECIRHISINDLQELCTEELLGISSKRLCATLDGADPPSDTESSSQSSPDLETISLDSISSDEGLLSPGTGKKKKHKHRRRESTSKSKCKRKRGEKEEVEGEHQTVASRAGLTVLELLELQARARAIRAQLHLHQEHSAVAKPPSETQPIETSTHSDGHQSDVEIKEEPAEVVEISSDEEKPKVEELNAAAEKPPPQEPTKEAVPSLEPETVTKHVNDLIITIPQAKPTRKIKLNRNKVLISVPNVPEKSDSVPIESRSVVVNKEVRDVSKPKKKQKKKGKKKSDAKEGSDHDEITLQLSDSEKMDLLEDLDRKVFDSVTSSEDSESSSSDDDEEMEREKLKEREKAKDREKLREKQRVKEKEILKEKESLKQKEKDEEMEILKDGEKEQENQNEMEEETLEDKEKSPGNDDSPKKDNDVTVLDENLKCDNVTDKKISDTTDKCTDISKEDGTNIEDSTTDVNIENNDNKKETNKPIEVQEQAETESVKSMENTESELTETKRATDTEISQSDDGSTGQIETNIPLEISTVEDIPIINDESKDSITNTENSTTEKERTNIEASETASVSATVQTGIVKDRSDGEVSDRDSSEVEAVDLKPEVVCISDEEQSKKKKKKKEKKKKEKKSKKSKSDFREGADQNFYRDTNECSIDDDVYEILELSDDSSCYEVAGTVLSKEPTAEEIAALSAKIDEIDRDEVVTEEQIQEYENSEVEKCLEAAENISWKDRYLDSRKVKRVLSTANILNALRKKNKELKKKMEESKKDVPLVIEEVVNEVKENLEEGTIEQYNTLQGSTKYVDPIPEVTEDVNNTKENNLESSIGVIEGLITREMKKDAKQLLKMYKRLLKYNDIHKEKDPNKKKKKKLKKNKNKNKDGVNGSVAITEVTNGV